MTREQRLGARPKQKGEMGGKKANFGTKWKK
jgi:hypothetical protein